MKKISALGGKLERIFDGKGIGSDQELISELFSAVFCSPSSYKYIIKVTKDRFAIVLLNNIYEENAGFSDIDITGKTPYEIFDRDTADNFYKHYSECLKKGQPISYRETINLPGGEKHFITFLTPVARKGQVEYLVGEKIDNTAYLNEVRKNRQYKKMITGQVSLLRSLFNISMGFTKSAYQDFEKQVDDSLSLLGDILPCDLIGIFKFFQDEECARRIKSWQRDDGKEPGGGAAELWDGQFTAAVNNKKSFAKKINGNAVKDFVKLYKKEGGVNPPGDKVKSAISLPVVYNDEIWGYITYCHLDEHKEWNEHEIEALMLFGDIFINTFFRIEAERQLRVLSEKDSLTGLDNRLSLMKNLEFFDKEDYLPFGFVFMDVNGLKMTNDCFGHNVGDDLLITTAEILKALGGACYPTRMGGDEFALLCPNCRESELLAMPARIKDACKHNGNLPIPLSISAGCAVRKSLDQTIAETVEKAEINMYKQKAQEAKAVKNEIMEYFMQKMASGDPFSLERRQRVISLAGRLGETLQLREIELEKLKKALLFYDIGYVPLSQKISPRSAAFTEEIDRPLESHCETGYYIAMAMPFLQPVAEIILSHHENWDGSGYPQGLKGQEIPFISRIIALADYYVSLTMAKPDSPALDKKEAVREIEKNAGLLFDPKIVKIFLELLKSVDEKA